MKTLEEPPEHVKFIFATTEIDKVPVTVRSRCQRFDLRRIDAGLLANHLLGVCKAEGVAIEPDALAMIARAAEGSARDALSLLDQAIAYGAAHSAGGAIAAEDLRLMLGVADKARIIDLFEAAMSGDIAKAIAILEDQYNGGADPAQVLLELAEFTHLATRLKLAPETAHSAALTPEEKRRGEDAATRLSVPTLTRAWQILMKGVDELRGSQRPLAAADMVLVQARLRRRHAVAGGDAAATGVWRERIERRLRGALDAKRRACRSRRCAASARRRPGTRARAARRRASALCSAGAKICNAGTRTHHRELRRACRACRAEAGHAPQDRARIRSAAGAV